MTEGKKPQFEAFIRIPMWINKDKEGKQELTMKLFGENITFRKKVRK